MTTVNYNNINELVTKGVVRKMMFQGKEMYQAVIYKGYIGKDKFALIHNLKINTDEKKLELINPDIVKILEKSDGIESYGKLTTREVTLIKDLFLKNGCIV